MPTGFLSVCCLAEGDQFEEMRYSQMNMLWQEEVSTNSVKVSRAACLGAAAT